MIFQNMNDKYVNRLKSLCQRYEVEISDVYKLNSIKKSEKNYKNLILMILAKYYLQNSIKVN